MELVDHAAKIIAGEMMHSVTELAGEIGFALFGEDLLQFFGAEGEQSPLRALMGAVAAVFCAQWSVISAKTISQAGLSMETSMVRTGE